MTIEDLAAVGLRLDLDGPIATVTLDRPDVRNAQTPAMWIALGEIGRTLPEDVKVVVVTGEGETFSAGLDRAMLDPASREEVLHAIRSYTGAIILVTHDEGAVRALDPDRVLLLPDGDEDLWSEDYADLVSLA